MLFSAVTIVAVVAYASTAANADCCANAAADDKFCQLYHMLSVPEQAEIHELWGENCDSDLKAKSKRKPNFIRFGKRSAGDEVTDFYRLGGMKKNDKPTFLRFGRAVDTPNFLRFGRKPNFLRFGKRKPNFLRFGKRSSDDFEREARKPNFLRFGRSVSSLDSKSNDEIDFNELRKLMYFGRSVDFQ